MLKMQTEYDIVIAGGGMVGASLAIALGSTDLRIALIEAVSVDNDQQPSYDDRGLALSLSSQRIYEALGVWQQVEMNANPIRRVHVSDRGHFGKVRMDAASLGLQALGHVVVARELGILLMAHVQALRNIDFICPAQVREVQQHTDKISLGLSAEGHARKLTSKLLVVADGTRSSIRNQLGINTTQIDYGQTAIVSNISPELAHADTAYERFTQFGPLAFLPLKDNRCVVVLTVPTDQSEHYLQLQSDQFLGEIQQRFGRRLGSLKRLGLRRSYPILQLQAEQQITDRAVLLGNSAHTIHPNGAQGFNLCLRDVAGLAEHLIQGRRIGVDPGSRSLLEAYQLSRLEDQTRVSRLTHGMSEWFYNSETSKAMLRNTAMTFMDLIPAAKTGFIRRGMGVFGKQPALVRGLEI